MIEAGKVYKVNRASLCKVLSIAGGIASVISWPILKGQHSIPVHELTCGNTSGNCFEEKPGGTWNK